MRRTSDEAAGGSCGRIIKRCVNEYEKLSARDRPPPFGTHGAEPDDLGGLAVAEV